MDKRELPSNLKKLFGCNTFGEANKQIKETETVIKQINGIVKDQTIEKVKELHAQGMSNKKIAISLDISISTVSRYLKK